MRDSSEAERGTERETAAVSPQTLADIKSRSRLAARLTLFGLNLVGDGVSACGQRGREEDVVGGSLVIRAGVAGLAAPAAQGLVRKGALQRSPWRLKGEAKKMGS